MAIFPGGKPPADRFKRQEVMEQMASQSKPVWNKCDDEFYKLTESISEDLAAAYLAKARLNEQIRDAGDQLSKELDSVSKAIQQAQKSNEAYGQTLAGASKGLTEADGVEQVRAMVDSLSTATRRVQGGTHAPSICPPSLAK